MSGRPYILGLTGSIGMGKSTTADFFREVNVPVWDADASVHRLYKSGGAGALAIEKIAPSAITDGAVDRGKLRHAIMDDASLLKQIETVIHPLVAADRQDFLDEHEDKQLVVCDIPLLFETDADVWTDGVLVVTADADVQKQRVIDRKLMTEEVFETILANQMPDAEKRRRADYLIDTGMGMDHARSEVLSLIERLKGN